MPGTSEPWSLEFPNPYISLIEWSFMGDMNINDRRDNSRSYFGVVDFDVVRRNDFREPELAILNNCNQVDSLSTSQSNCVKKSGEVYCRVT
jgi:hypothetical protein